MPLDQAPLNPSRHEYDRRILDACYRALATIVKAIDGQHHPRLVVIGGLAPTLLLDDDRTSTRCSRMTFTRERMTSTSACRLTS